MQEIQICNQKKPLNLRSPFFSHQSKRGGRMIQRENGQIRRGKLKISYVTLKIVN